ncbi:MAG: hypothetical protein U0792_00130 [Gemmataceae bacterium]
MELNIAKEVAAMQRMTAKQLRVKYAEVFGDGTNANNRTWLIRLDLPHPLPAYLRFLDHRLQCGSCRNQRSSPGQVIPVD